MGSSVAPDNLTKQIDNNMKKRRGRRDAMAQQSKESAGPPEGHPAEMQPVTLGDTGKVDFTAAGGATVAAILHLVRLMGAELVLVRGIDIAQFEQSVRARLGEFTSPTANQEARKAGLAHARYLVEQVLTQIRAQAELKKSLAVGNEESPELRSVSSAPPLSKLLN
jgi:fumarylacetoacetate (FAA) hydrolase family protein